MHHVVQINERAIIDGESSVTEHSRKPFGGSRLGQGNSLVDGEDLDVRIQNGIPKHDTANATYLPTQVSPSKSHRAHLMLLTESTTIQTSHRSATAFNKQ